MRRFEKFINDNPDYAWRLSGIQEHFPDINLHLIRYFLNASVLEWKVYKFSLFNRTFYTTVENGKMIDEYIVRSTDPLMAMIFVSDMR